jgi:ParB-like chromosome segregation protein Spo0J
MEAHPLCLLLPVMRLEEYKALKRDIKEHGLLSPIVVFEDMVLDGRHRLQACDELRIKPTFTRFKGDYDKATAYVLSHNLYRRHLTASQRARVAADLAEHFAEQAKARANLPTTGRARDKAAAAMGVSSRSVADAKRVKTKGTPKLDRAVRDGKVAVSAAAKATAQPAEVQDRAVDMVERGEAKTIAQAISKAKPKQASTVDGAEVRPSGPYAPWCVVKVDGRIVGHVVKHRDGWHAHPITDAHADRDAAVRELLAGGGDA